MQCSNVSAKINVGSTASDVMVTDPKNTGEECTFATTKRQLPLNAPFKMEQVSMFISEQLLLALTELLSARSEPDWQALELQCKGYKTNESKLSIWMSNQADEAWYFRPLGMWKSESKAIDDNGSCPDGWKIDSKSTELVRASIRTTVDLQFAVELSKHFLVIANDRIGKVFVARCSAVQLVARTIQIWGDPPESVVCDWQAQRDCRTTLFRQPSTSETLITEDGILIPLTNALSHLELTETERRNDVKKTLESVLERISAPEPVWPVRQNFAVHSGTLIVGDDAMLSAFKSRARGQKKRAKVFQKWGPQIGTTVGAIAILGLCILLISPSFEAVKAEKTRNAIPLDAERPANTNNATLSNLDNSEIAELETDADLTSFLSSTELTHSEPDFATILSQLKSSGLDSLSASSIVSDTLSLARPIQPTLAADSADDVEGFGEESNDSLKSVAPNATQSEGGTIKLQRLLRLQAASLKETVIIGKPVLAKTGICEIEWKIADKVVIEPSQKVLIEGNAKASWRIAIEDEDPELVVEIASKPGSRWQIVTTIGLREGPNSIPMLIGPRDAQNVSLRLIEYHQWLVQDIESLRWARSNSRSNSRANFRERMYIDWTGEIRRLEIQKRDADKAIDRWRVVARLCHYFFDSNQVQIQFTAVEKR